MMKNSDATPSSARLDNQEIRSRSRRRRRTLLRLVSLPLSAVLLASGCWASTLGAARSSITASPSQNPAPVSLSVVDPCPSAQVNFNGECRTIDFFQKLLTPGATLLGVAGPISKSQDSGAVVLEGFGNGVVRALSVLPNKLAPGAPALRTRIYHADYPITHITSIQSWVDPNGYANTFTAELGPTFQEGLGFGLVSWSHRADTISGYSITNSDGTGVTAISSSTGKTSYCDTAAATAGTVADGACLTGAAIDSLLAGATAGVWTLVLTAADLPVAIGVAAIVTGTAGTMGTELCSALSNLATAVVRDECNTGPTTEINPADIKFLPYLPEVPSTPVNGACPTGTVLYSGQVITCHDEDQVTYSGGEVTVTSGNVCDVISVSNVCAVP
jgi:hypothetical protein